MELEDDIFINDFEENVLPKNSTPLIKSLESFESGYSTGHSIESESDLDQSLSNSFKSSKNVSSFAADNEKEPCLTKQNQDIVIFKSLQNPKLPIITLTPINQEKKILETTASNDKKQVKPSSNFLTVSTPESKKLYPLQNDLLSSINHSCPLITSSILSYLNPNELSALCITSKTHQSIVISHKSANQRRLSFLENIKNLKNEMGQENWPMKKPLERAKSRGILVNVENFENTTIHFREEKKMMILNEKKMVKLSKKRKDINSLIEIDFHLNQAFYELKKLARKQRFDELKELSIGFKKSKVKKEAGLGNSISKRNLRRL